MQERLLGMRLAGWVVCASALVPACQSLPEPPNVPPTASFVFSPVSPILAGATPVTFNAAGSRDSDGTIVSYTFNFGDGTQNGKDHLAAPRAFPSSRAVPTFVNSLMRQ